MTTPGIDFIRGRNWEGLHVYLHDLAEEELLAEATAILEEIQEWHTDYAYGAAYGRSDSTYLAHLRMGLETVQAYFRRAVMSERLANLLSSHKRELELLDAHDVEGLCAEGFLPIDRVAEVKTLWESVL